MYLRKDNEIDEANWLSLPSTNNNIAFQGFILNCITYDS